MQTDGGSVSARLSGAGRPGSSGGSGSLSVPCDIVSICSHLARTSPQHLPLLLQAVKGPAGISVFQTLHFKRNQMTIDPIGYMQARATTPFLLACTACLVLSTRLTNA